MAIISLYTQLVLRARELASVDRQRLEIIQGQAQRASELLRQILDFSRQSVVDMKPIDMSSFVREAVRAVSQGLPALVQVRASLCEGDCFILGDSARLLQTIENLAANANEAMPEGGQLTITLRRLKLVAGDTFPLPDMSAGDWICLSVADDGVGMSPQILARVFEPFFTTKALGQGTGLGLAQVYGIVKLHDGFINVESSPGQGAMFDIYLPAFTPPQEKYRPRHDDSLYAGSGQTILIVEDDRATREALAEYLQALNYTVLTAANGREALQIYNQSQNDVQLVLTDMVMPVMDGATLFAQLRQARSDVKLIAITGYPLDPGIVDLLKQEVFSFIQKPLRVEQIARSISEALSQDHD
jgi:CheY-like chemotaxis protein